MNSMFRKTLIATALSAILSTAAIAADDYQDTIDADQPDQSRQNSQRDNSLNNRNTTDLDNEAFEDTIDGDMAADNQGRGQHNRAGKEPCYDDMEATGSGRNPGMQNQNSQDLPETDHQDNVTDEEEEEEEVMPRTGNDSTGDSMPRAGGENADSTEIDYSDDSNMDNEMNNPANTGTAQTDDMTTEPSNLLSMSPDELIGMSVVDNEGEEVGHVSKIVLSPDQQNVHAVVTVGSIMGLGGRDVLASLNELSLVNEELHIEANQDQIAEMTDYGSDDYLELEGDTPISTAIRPE